MEMQPGPWGPPHRASGSSMSYRFKSPLSFHLSYFDEYKLGIYLGQSASDCALLLFLPLVFKLLMLYLWENYCRSPILNKCIEMATSSSIS